VGSNKDAPVGGGKGKLRGGRKGYQKWPLKVAWVEEAGYYTYQVTGAGHRAERKDLSESGGDLARRVGGC